MIRSVFINYSLKAGNSNKAAGRASSNAGDGGYGYGRRKIYRKIKFIQWLNIHGRIYVTFTTTNFRLGLGAAVRTETTMDS